MKIFSSLLFAVLIIHSVYPQEFNSRINDDSIVVKPDYRRINQNNLPSPGKYAQPKEEVFPLGWKTNTLGKVTTGTGLWRELNPLVPRTNYTGLHFVNKDTGWACGGSGAIIKTTNGGGSPGNPGSWTISETPVNNLLTKIHTYNGQVVVAVGYDGIILHSSDEGETFEQIPTGTTSDLWGVKMLNDTLGWVCGMNWTLLKTTDAGQNWQSVTAGLNDHYWALDFMNEQYGMVACGGGKILKTINGGNTWTMIQAGDERALYTIEIIDSLHIAAAGFYGKNVYSSDGGTTWIQNTDVPAFSAVNWIDFIDADTGYCVRDVYNIAKTTNRGQSWFNPNAALTISEWHIQLLEDGTGYSCGEEIGGGSALNFNKRTNWLDNWSRVFLNYNWNDVFFVNETKGFIISPVLGAGMYKTEDGGISYQKIENAPGGNDLFFFDSLTGFVAGTHKTTDGGENWYATNGGGTKVFFVDNLIGWSIGGRNIYKTTNAGEDWFVQFTHPTLSFTSIHFADSLYGWTSGGRPQKTTDGGLTWIEQTNTTLWNSDDVYFTNHDTGWFAKYSSINNSLFRTTNGGLNWIAIYEVIGARKFYFFPDPIHWLTIGFSRYYITINYGSSWIEFTQDVPAGLVSFYALTNNLGYMVGSSGLILKYEDTTYVPVELISFEGKIESEAIVLSWVTASELNNQGFYIEKSFDKIIWQTIGFLTGKGTTTETNYYSFVDNESANEKINYRLKQQDFDGSIKYSDIIEVEIGTPSEFYLSQNYPNPFNPETIIDYKVPIKTFINISLFDIKGEKVRELVNEVKQPGYYTIKLRGDELSSGIYFYRLFTGSGYTAVKKLTIIK